MKANVKKENINQHRRRNLERLDEIRHRQNRLSTATRRRNEESPSGIHGKTQVDCFEIHSIELVLVALILCISAWIWAYPWNMISVILTAILLAITVIGIVHRYVKRREQSKLLKNPFETQFYIPKAIEHKVDYYSQDDNIHMENKLTLTSNSEHDVMIRSRARLDVTLLEVQYGCMDYMKGVDYLKAMPEPLYYANPWVKKGLKREIHPEESEEHYVDTANTYHIVCSGRVRPKGGDLLHGLRIKTKEKGTYTFGVVYIMPDGEARNDLTIKVV